jgi:hypothetical protein
MYLDLHASTAPFCDRRIRLAAMLTVAVFAPFACDMCHVGLRSELHCSRFRSVIRAQFPTLFGRIANNLWLSAATGHRP